jgi:hypothetical protein
MKVHYVQFKKQPKAATAKLISDLLGQQAGSMTINDIQA